jgi:hypothetical protein
VTEWRWVSEQQRCGLSSNSWTYAVALPRCLYSSMSLTNTFRGCQVPASVPQSQHIWGCSKGPLPLARGSTFERHGLRTSVIFVLWFVSHNCCWIADRLERRNLPHLDKCLLCDQKKTRPFNIIWWLEASLRASFGVCCCSNGGSYESPRNSSKITWWLMEQCGWQGYLYSPRRAQHLARPRSLDPMVASEQLWLQWSFSKAVNNASHGHRRSRNLVHGRTQRTVHAGKWWANHGQLITARNCLVALLIY